MKNILISVIVPCYNQAQYLDECLQSILDQTYQNWECIIVNDGSPDNTEEIALQWTKKDTRFIYLKKVNGGLSSARNAGIEKAKGEWILPLDSDDKIGCRYLELASAQFNHDYTIIYCEAEFFGEGKGKLELPDFSFEEFAIRNLIFCTAFFKKESWINVNGYDEKIVNGYEDWEFWISILNVNSKCFKISSINFYYRTKVTSMTKDFHCFENEKIKTLKYIYKKHSDFFIDHIKIPYQMLYLKYIELETEKEVYKKAYQSKRYRFGNFLFSLIDKLKK